MTDNGAAQPNQCIYCLTTDADFGSVEHIFGESLGNHELILPKGYVCTPCNNGPLSRRDQYLAEFPAVSFFRPFYVLATKKGKVPSAQFGDISVTRPREGHIKVWSKRQPVRSFVT